MSEGRETLLFVDDERDVLEILSQVFGDDYHVLTATSGAEALEILEKRRVELLVTDQRMPGMTGVRLIEAARRLDPELTSVLLTAYTDPPDIIDAINRGQVYRFVTKPWDLGDLLLTVRGALDRVRLRRENVQLLAEAQHRLAALEVMYEVSRASATLSTYGAIVDRVTALLERVVALDVSAALVRAEPDRPATLTLRTRSAVSESDLQDLKEAVLARHRALTGEPLTEKDVVVRLTGRHVGQGDGPPTGRRLDARLFIPLHAGGRPTGILGVAAYRPEAFGPDDERVLDILANQTAEAIAVMRTKVDAERRRTRRMVEGMADGLVMTDASGEVVVTNSAARRLLGVADGEQVTSRFLRDTVGFYPFDLVRGWERQGARPVSEDLEVGGHVLHSIVSPVTAADGSLTGVVVVLRDVTEERLLQKKKEEFVSVISHELRTPLTAILGAQDLILNGLAGDINEKQRRYLSLAKISANRLNEIVDDLLDLARIARGGLQLELSVTTLDEVIQEALDRYEAAFQSRKIEVTFANADGPIRVLVDEGRTGQVLNNLLTNAAKFTPEGGRVEVEIFRQQDVGEAAGFSIWNSGEHIPAADLDRIFEQFEQAGSAAGRRIRGTGLGLPICRSIVQAHGGRIWAESAPGKGARFIVVLPLEGAAEAQPAPVEEPEAPSTATLAPALVRVLVVDDDRPAAYALKSILLAAGHEIEVAHDADEALVLARRRRPQVMIVDIRMPEIDGVRLIEILRHDPETRGVPILAISGAEDGDRARRAGAQGFLAKPVDGVRLAATVRALASAGREGRRVLVVDDDPGIRSLCADALAGLGYQVAEAADAAQTRSAVLVFRPDLILLDLMLPDVDGYDLLEELKTDRATSFTSVVLISARSETRDKVRALRLGGDDYLVKPFDALELAARVERVLRRRDGELQASPTTGLPGGALIERDVNRRVSHHEPFALCYLDIDNLKAFNDYYGYAKADGVIHQTGDLLREVLENAGGPKDFLGHIAGDDFVFVTTPDRADAVCRSAIEAFDRIIPLYYERDDRQRGYIEAEDRYGTERQFPIMTISVVAVVDPGGRYASHAEMAAVAAGLKRRAKSVEGSVYLREDVAQSESA